MYLYFSPASSIGHIAKENESTLHVDADGEDANRDGVDGDDDVYDYNVHEESDEGGGAGDTETETDETIETDETEKQRQRQRKTTVMTELICKSIKN